MKGVDALSHGKLDLPVAYAKKANDK